MNLRGHFSYKATFLYPKCDLFGLIVLLKHLIYQILICVIKLLQWSLTPNS
jgi:hypothetical protein